MLTHREAPIKNGDSPDASIHQLESEVAMLREELRINSARMRRVRPTGDRSTPAWNAWRSCNCGPCAVGTNRKRVVTSWSPTTRSETGCAESTMTHSCRPQHRSIGFRMSCVTPREQIKLFCPTLGKLKIAEKLARAGMHIGKSPVERILKERPVEPPHPTDADVDRQVRIVSKYPGHTWNADLTAVPISGGFWTPWIPNSISPRWPACWWVLNVIDHFSRRSLGCGVFQSRPISAEVTAMLDRIMSAEQVRPKHLIVDQGSEFKCEHFEHVWCQAQDILPRFGAVGKHGSIAVVERFHRTLKELLRLTTIPEDQTAFERELGLIIDWYNEHRPHETFRSKTPNEVHYSRLAANQQPRFEPRTKWPRGSLHRVHQPAELHKMLPQKMSQRVRIAAARGYFSYSGQLQLQQIEPAATGGRTRMKHPVREAVPVWQSFSTETSCAEERSVESRLPGDTNSSMAPSPSRRQPLTAACLCRDRPTHFGKRSILGTV